MFPGWTVGKIAVLIVVCLALAALVFVASTAFGVAIPPWVMHCIWIVVVAFVVILCIKLVMSMGDAKV